MRVVIAFLLGIAVTVAAAYVHDTGIARASDKPLVNWEQVGGATHDVYEAARAEWNKLIR